MNCGPKHLLSWTSQWSRRHRCRSNSRRRGRDGILGGYPPEDIIQFLVNRAQQSPLLGRLGRSWGCRRFRSGPGRPRGKGPGSALGGPQVRQPSVELAGVMLFVGWWHFYDLVKLIAAGSLGGCSAAFLVLLTAATGARVVAPHPGALSHYRNFFMSLGFRYRSGLG